MLMVQNFQAVAVNQFKHFDTEILMVLETSRSYCESIIDGLESLMEVVLLDCSID